MKHTVEYAAHLYMKKARLTSAMPTVTWPNHGCATARWSPCHRPSAQALPVPWPSAHRRPGPRLHGTTVAHLAVGSRSQNPTNT